MKVFSSKKAVNLTYLVSAKHFEPKKTAQNHAVNYGFSNNHSAANSQ
jgi:hypothetical protein